MNIHKLSKPLHKAYNAAFVLVLLFCLIASRGFPVKANNSPVPDITPLAHFSPTGQIKWAGDANEDGIVNMGDAVRVMRIILGLAYVTTGADANNDSLINMGDVTRIERVILGFDAQSADMGWLISSDPALVDNASIPLTPVAELHNTGTAPEVEITGYNLAVDGLVENPATLSYETLLNYPPVTDTVLLICRGFFADNAQWTGVPVATILAEAGVMPEASQVTFYALDGYRQTLNLSDALGAGVFLAYKVNAQTLPKEQGYPLRLVVEGKYGSNWIKWVNRLEVK